MSLSWRQRKARLDTLLSVTGQGEEEEGRAIDRIIHGQTVIGKTAKTTEVDKLRFQDKDLDVVGTLAYGQFGVIDVVNCRLNNKVYVRKSIEKRFAMRNRDQCFPLNERHLLLASLTTNSPWAPHLLCAFQTTTKLCYVMDYAEGGTLWDVLESSPLDGKIKEGDLRWWIPQAVSAIAWCHEQGYAHRDVKPHNFVLTPSSHVQLIDFGSAAPLIPGTQRLPKRYCLVPCGTCDYISPEILQAHEEALVEFEMHDDDEELEVNLNQSRGNKEREGEEEGYGSETDWWSLGAMFYEMAYGVAPFYANDVRQTYLRIMNHQKSLRFESTNHISSTLQDFLQRLLTDATHRLGRNGIDEVSDHPLFDEIDWVKLPYQKAPSTLHLPQFTYTEPQVAPQPQDNQDEGEGEYDESISQGFPFSAFFQSSSLMTQTQTQNQTIEKSPGLSLLRTPASNPNPTNPHSHLHTHSITKSILKSSIKSSSSVHVRRDEPSSAFIGFTWGPMRDAFPSTAVDTPTTVTKTPARLRVPSTHVTPLPDTPLPGHHHAAHHPFSTPLRFGGGGAMGTIGRSTVRRTAQRRMVSDREAMKMLVDCVGMSARKKVLESGRKPRLLTRSFSLSRSGGGSKELRWEDPIPAPDYECSTMRGKGGRKIAGLVIDTQTHQHSEQSELIYPYPYQASTSASASLSLSRSLSEPALIGGLGQSETETETESEGPPSPSPSPRPGSAMSVLSSWRSATPTITGFSGFSLGSGSGSGRHGRRSATPTITSTFTLTRTSSSSMSGSRSLLSVPGTARRMSFEELGGGGPSGGGGGGRREGGEGSDHSDEMRRAGDAKSSAGVNEPKAAKAKARDTSRSPDHGWETEQRKETRGTKVDFEEMEKRHRRIMLDLGRLEGRLEEVKRGVGIRVGVGAGR